MARPGSNEGKVLHVINRLAPGGAEKQLLGSIKHSAFDQEVVELAPDGSSRGRETLPRLRQTLRKAAADIVVAWLQRPQIAVAATAPRQTRLVASVCSMPLRKAARDQWLLRAAYTRYDYLFAPTNIVREATRIFAAPITLPNFVVVPLALDVPGEFFRPVDRDGPLRVGFIGRANPVKGLDVLLAALDRFEAVEVAPVLIGEGVPEMVRTFGGQATTYRTFPRTDDPWHAAGPLDVLVFPSRSEAAGLVVLEAFARGIPVIATRAGGAHELVDEGRALVVRIDDAEGLTTAIRKVAADPAGARARAENAHRYVLAVHTWPRVGAAYDHLYDAVLRG